MKLIESSQLLCTKSMNGQNEKLTVGWTNGTTIKIIEWYCHFVSCVLNNEWQFLVSATKMVNDQTVSTSLNGENFIIFSEKKASGVLLVWLMMIMARSNVAIWLQWNSTQAQAHTHSLQTSKGVSLLFKRQLLDFSCQKEEKKIYSRSFFFRVQ